MPGKCTRLCTGAQTGGKARHSDPVQDRDRVGQGERWRALFDDLEGQAAELEAAELAAEVADRTRREVALLRLVDRLRAAVDRPLRVGLVSGETVRARLGRVVRLAARPRSRRSARRSYRVASLASVVGLGQHSATPGSEGPVQPSSTSGWRCGLLPVTAPACSCSCAGAAVLAGMVGRVGADFLELFDPEGGRDPAAPRVRPDRSAGTLTVSVQNVVLRAPALNGAR